MAASIACICGGVSTSVQLHSGIDHSKLQLCHCNSCRTGTGQLASSYYLLQNEPPSLDGLQEHQFNHISRFFCKICGAHIFARLRLGGRFLVASGLLVAKDVPSVREVEHWQNNDTGDGGLSGLLPGMESTTVGCRLSAVNRPKKLNYESVTLAEYPPTQRLRAGCLCGGVEFYITKPDKSSLQASSPWADLLMPYYTGAGANPDDIKWWLRDKNRKYLAGTCACNTCRMSSGFPIQAWAFIPKSNIFESDGSPLAFKAGTLQRYNSSPDVCREFCRCCGATAFWHCEERPLLIDVSVGLLQANGARAEDWLEWVTSRVSFAEMAVQPDLVQRLADGLVAHSRRVV